MRGRERQTLGRPRESGDCVSYRWFTGYRSRLGARFAGLAGTTVCLALEGGNAVYPLLLNKFLGTRFKLVLGYQGGNTIELAMERGEVEGRGSVIWSGLKALWPQWVAARKFNILLQIGLRKEADLPEVPLLIDLAKTSAAGRGLSLHLERHRHGLPRGGAARRAGGANRRAAQGF